MKSGRRKPGCFQHIDHDAEDGNERPVKNDIPSAAVDRDTLYTPPMIAAIFGSFAFAAEMPSAFCRSGTAAMASR